jgi:GNAT superfamily N-acetyltransferase
MAVERDRLFSGPGYAAVRLGSADVAALQAFFEANPAYFEAVNGEPAGATEAQQAVDELPPPGMPFEALWVIGCLDPSGELVAMAVVVSRMIDPQVWHLGLFIVATAQHGQGLAQRFYAGLEDWVQAAGALWMRLGVVQGNARAERFWARRGYAAVRERGPVAMGQLQQRVTVMVKPLETPGLDAYLDRVIRDRPEPEPSGDT